MAEVEKSTFQGAVRTISKALRHWTRAALGDDPVRTLTIVLLVAGCLFRILNFVGARSLWLDEAMVADSIVHRDWAGLLQPLTYNQIAPLGWLFMERAAVEVFGGSELALRLPSLVAGIGALFLFAGVARRSLDKLGSLLAVAFFAVCPELVKYSAEVKPYGFDVLVSVAALAFAVCYLQHSAPLRARDLLALLVFGLVSVLVSFPAAFVLAGLGGALFLAELARRRWRTAGLVGVVSAAWLMLFLWLLSREHQATDSNVAPIAESWSGAYAPSPTSLDALKWYPKAVLDAFDYLFETQSMVVWGLAATFGIIVTLRSRPLFALALLAPFAAALVASGLHLYPFSQRLLLFALPQLALLALIGVQAAIAASRTPVIATIAAAILLLFASATRLWGEFTYYPAPFGSEHMAPVLHQIADRGEADAIYVNRDGLPAFRRYAATYGLAGIPVIEGRSLRHSFGCLLADLEIVSRNRRVWVLYSHADTVIRNIPEDVLFTYVADATGRRIFSADLISVHAYLYEFDEEGAERVSAIRRALGDSGACPTRGSAR